MAITRDNYESYLQEPPLTKAEWQMLHAFRRFARQRKGLHDAIDQATKDEQAALLASSKLDTPDWSGFVAQSDATARLFRAQIAWWEGWKAGVAA